ncbi:pentatricopeptide repeat-containing protein [Senna tora]|uniref:Pentatricopeptide repeat-containing protein n=1 Tax=Senna tora TaxID=362788 RepID=A0A834X2B1_9FABA|nr:pentatricopeptide repeat-containing protein [Senna tora]
MRSLLRSAPSLKNQDYCRKLYRLLCTKLHTPSNVRVGECYSAQLTSRKLFMREESYHSHSLSNFGNGFLGTRGLSSKVCGQNSEESDAKGALVELENLFSANVFEEEEGEPLVSESEPGFLDEDMSDSEEGQSSREPLKEKASLELLRTIMENPVRLISSTLENYVKGGGDLSRREASKIIYRLRKHRMYGRALQLSRWLESNQHFELTEYDYASHIDLIAKLQGVDVAEKYMNNVPHSFRGELLFRTLLTNSVHAVNRNKAEAVFNKMRELGDILLLMEDKNLKPNHLTYRNLIAMKNESKDTMGMEQLVKDMKSRDLQPDIHVLTIMATHYISKGMKDKALAILNEIEGGDLQKSHRAQCVLLSLYASLDMADDVSRIWTNYKSDPIMKVCLAAIAAWGKLGKVEEAEAVFDMMLEKWKKVPSNSYAELLAVYVQNNNIAKGKEFAKGMGDVKGWVGPRVWDGLVRLYVGDGDVEKADSILRKAFEIRTVGQVRPMFNTFLFVMEQYAKLGDVHNTEKWLFRMKQCGYVGRLRPFIILIQAYINARTPAYGLRERMKAENVYPNRTFSLRLAEMEAIQREILLFKSIRKKESDDDVAECIERAWL